MKTAKKERCSPTLSLPAPSLCVAWKRGGISHSAAPLVPTAAVGHADSHALPARSGVHLSPHDWAYQVAIKDQLWRRDSTLLGVAAELSRMSRETTWRI